MSLLLLHTFGSHSARYDRLAGEIALQGITVEAFDFQGHGESDGDRGAIAPWHALLDDVEDRLAALRSEFGPLPAGLYGHGLGGLVAVDYLEGDRPQPDLAVLIAPSLMLPHRLRPLQSRLRGLFGSSTVRLVDDPASLAMDPELARSWASDPLVVWSYLAESVLAVLDAQGRVASGYERVQLPLWTSQPHDDVLAAPARFPPLDQGGSPDRRTQMSGGRHDAPLDDGWRGRNDDLVSWLVLMGQRHWPAVSPAPIDVHREARRSRAEATAAFEAFVAGEPDRLARFGSLVARLGGPPPACDRESLAQLGAWLIDALEWGEPGPGRPAWATPSATGHQLSDESVDLIDGLAAHYASCLQQLEPLLEWRLCTDRIDAYYQRAVLEPIHLTAPGPMLRAISVARSETPNREWLGELWDAWQMALERMRNRPHDLVDDPFPLDEIAVDPYDGSPFNAQIWIPEGAEAVLGKDGFLALPGRLARLKGVEDLVHEDREIMLVRVAADQDLDELRRRVVGVMRRLKRAAEGEPDAGTES